jgi:hypothetical protein
MNIFILDRNPIKAAQDQCDKHVCKMVIESAQMLCLKLPEHLSPYKQVYKHHPCSKWVLQSKENYAWMLQHAQALSDEYTYRYGRTHKCDSIIKSCAVYFSKYNTIGFPDDGLTPFAQAMPDEYKNPDAVQAYRAYYLGEKKRFAKWANGRSAPDWWK